MSDHGLTEEQVAILRSVLAPYAGVIDRVGLFGSRATGKYRPNSDIDMVLYGAVDKAMQDHVQMLFDESYLPVKVDVVAYDLVTYPAFKEHIDKVMRPLFAKSDLAEGRPA